MSAALAVCALYFAVLYRDRLRGGQARLREARRAFTSATAISARCRRRCPSARSDSSGWVFTGAVGFAYVCGASMMWICVGYTVGIFCNYVFVAPRPAPLHAADRRGPRFLIISRCASPSAARGCGSPPLLSSRYSSPSYAAGQLTSAGKVFEGRGLQLRRGGLGRGLCGHLLHLPRRLQGRSSGPMSRRGVAILAVLALFPGGLRHACWRLARFLGEALDD